MQDIPEAVIVENLEEITGADIMLSCSEIPVTTKALIKLHVEQGAILVQRKHGHDLSSSVGERLNMSLAKMQSIGATYPQCRLLFVGFMSVDKQGIATINKRETGMQFFHLQGAISKWIDRGGVYESLPKGSLLHDWCRMKLRHLKEYANYPEKHQLASPPRVERDEDEIRNSDPLQLLYPVNDARPSTMPG
jgi:hypothetical protein